jgi:hypothetical protein
MRACNWILAGALTAVSCVVPVGAQVLTYELRGTVDQISDDAGVLGSPQPGTTFTLTYVADFSAGSYNGAMGGFGGSNWLIGGSAFAPDPFYPTIQLSPVSALLEINGHELDFLGTSYGQVQYTQNWLEEQFGGYGTSWADFSAETRAGSDGTLLSRITSALISPFSAATFGSIDALGGLQIDGSLISGSTSFSYLWAAGTLQETLLSGNLTPTAFSVTTAIPEPQSWMLLAGGLAGLVVLGKTQRQARTGASRRSRARDAWNRPAG